MIKEIFENDFDPFFNLMAEVECGNLFDFGNPNHINWPKKRISVHFYRKTRFFAYYLDDGTPVGFAGLLIEEGAVEARKEKEEKLKYWWIGGKTGW